MIYDSILQRPIGLEAFSEYKKTMLSDLQKKANGVKSEIKKVEKQINLLQSLSMRPVGLEARKRRLEAYLSELDDKALSLLD